MADDSQSVVRANLERLQATTETVQLVMDHQPRNCRLEILPNGQPQLFLGDRAVYPGPLPVDRAMVEARNLVEGKRPDLVVFFGLGLGLHVDFLRQYTSAPIIIFEPSLDVAAVSLANITIDLPDVYLAVDGEGFAFLLGSLLKLGQKEIIAGAIPNSGEAFPEQFEQFRTEATTCLDNLKVAHTTMGRFASLWTANLAGNLPTLGRMKRVSCLKEAFQGKPAIFVGAGPSLDRNLDLLVKAKGQFLLVAAHTALIPLARVGITPEMVAIIEGQRLDHYFHEIDNLAEMTLLPSPQTHPAHLTLGFKNCLGFSLEDTAAADWLGKAFGEEPLHTGGSVACTAFSILHHLGCHPLVCVGMDLAYSEGRSHALGTDHGCCDAVTDVEKGITYTHCREGFHRDWEYPTTMVTAWGGKEQVATRSDLASFCHWFEQAARTWLSDSTLINANGAGARIRGFSEMTLEEVLKRYGGQIMPTVSLIERTIEGAAPRDSRALAAVVGQELEVIRKAGSAAVATERVAEKAISYLEKGRLQTVQPLLDKLADQEGRLRELTRQTRLLDTLVGNRARNVAAEKPEGDQVARTIASLQQSCRLCRLVSEGAAELADLFAPAVKSLKQGKETLADYSTPGGILTIVGTGNFATNLSALVTSFGLQVKFFVDEKREGPFLDRPVHTAAQLDEALIRSVDKWLIAISDPGNRQAAVERLRAQGVAAIRIMPLADDPDLQILKLIFDRNGKAALLRFYGQGVTGTDQLESKFLGPAVKQVMSTLDPGRPTIGLGYYGRGGGFRGHISPLIPLLEERFNVVTMSDEVMSGDQERHNHLYLGSSQACSLAGLDLVLSANVFPCSPPEVPRVSFSHVIPDFTLSAEYHASRIGYSQTHYLYASSRPCFDWYVAMARRFKLSNRLCVIPGGNLHLDWNMAKLKGAAQPAGAVLYAPTQFLAEYPHRDLVTSLDQGPDIFAALLAAFPEREIIFRPHPSDLRLYELGRKDVRSTRFASLMELCRSEPRCRLDDNLTSCLDSFSRASVMVSDSSSTAFTFAFSTGRPVVFFSPREPELVGTLAQDLQFVRDRQQIGQVAATIPDLISVLGPLLENAGQASQASQAIAEFRDRMIFNPGSSAQYFVDNIDFILKGVRHPDWYYLNW